MASPFYLFRKYQRAFIAIAAVVAMFIFVVADPLMQWLQSSGGGGPQRSGKEVVATWDGGELNLAELEQLTQRRFKISEFLRNLYGRAARTIEEEGGTPLPPSLPPFILQRTNPQSVQQGCVTTRAFAQLAKESNISVSDSFINHYLKEWGLGKAGDAEIGNLLREVRLTDKALFAGLRELLMTHFYTNGYSLVTRGVTPQERWQDWKQINERIVLEVAQLPVDSFISEVAEPTDAQLKTFYTAHKEQVGESYEMVRGVALPSPEPGFRIPRRVKIQYLLGNLDDWTQKTLDQVSDKEIADYYERNKRTQFVKTSSSATSPAARRSTSVEGLFDDDDSETDNSEGESDAETSDAEEPAMTDEATSAESSTEETPTEETPVEDALTNEKATEAATEAESATEPATEPATGETGLKTSQSPFRLVALQQDAVEEATEAVAEEASSDEQSSEETPTGNDDAEANDGDTDAGDDADADDEVVEFVPLEEVADQIRRALAEEKATTELETLIESTSGKLEENYTPYGYSVVEAKTEGKEAPEPPAELTDYKAIATETGLISEETALLSQQQLSEAIIGRAVDAKTGRQYVYQAMFGDIGLYEPFVAIDGANNAFIACKTKDVPTRVPEFDEVRDQVVAAWKQAEAVKLAEAKAKELAEAAKASGDRISVAAGAKNYQVVTTDPFSWLTFGTTQAEMQRGPRLAQIPPLEAVGDNFMAEAFQLEPDQKVAVMNHDKTFAYVIQLDRREQTEAELKSRFLSDSVNGWYGEYGMNLVRVQEAQRQVYADLTEQINLNLDGLSEFFAENAQ